MSQYATNPQTLEEALEPEKVQVKNWSAFIESEVVNFFNTYKLEKMTLEDVDKKSKNRTSKWKNLLKSRKYEKQKCRIDEKFSKALLQLKSTEIDFISDKLEQGYSKEDLLKIMIPGIGIEKMEAICNLIKKESR